MARRKRSEDEHENLERWLVSYADFITLLFAFFVVMYSISSINEGKYRVLSRTLAEVFMEDGRKVSRAGEPVQIYDGEPGEYLVGSPETGLGAESPEPTADGDPQREQARLETVADRLEAVLSPYIQDDLAVVKRHEFWLEVEMKSGLFFPSGKAALAPESLPVLYRLSEIFREIPNPINIEGHTDNMPISTAEFPSNWVLSSARAAAVVNQLTRNGVDPRRLAAIGYGEYHPVAENANEEGRYRNRRVVLVVMSNGAARYGAPALDAPPRSAAPPAPATVKP
ncbi:flagellar motor protein MotD [Methylomagnum ishizawai]|uniref:flagellar motor protein MotD n=1 Tax=Methylomagnum ishizawai TaxID=1760988 RepID=UPI001C326006|nr:flagellar motor protein MotD [Methylomagnum ishizawai]BBL74727.1 flagellar motor protein MotD [Methylomagnum ishizawai]